MREIISKLPKLTVKTKIDLHLEVTGYISDYLKKHEDYPLFEFVDICGYPDFNVYNGLFGNRENIRSILNVSRLDSGLAHRLSRSKVPKKQSLMATEELTSLNDLPILVHQPKDGGRYITAGLLVLEDEDNSNWNTGIYRIMQNGANSGAILLGRHSDAYRLVSSAKSSVRAKLCIGVHPAHYLVGASSVESSEDSFEVASRLAGKRLGVTNDDIPVPAESEIVIDLEINPSKKVMEGPFGDLKKTYDEKKKRNSVTIHNILTRQKPNYYSFFAGYADAINVSSVIKEAQLYRYLIDNEMQITSVHRPLLGQGEFALVIQTENPSWEVVDLAMKWDALPKIVAVCKNANLFPNNLLFYNSEMKILPYFKGGDRLGVLINEKHEPKVKF